jgi:hypothetical protein
VRGLVITVHAIAGVVAFGAGCDALLRRRWFGVFFWALTAMVVFLGAAIAVDWSTTGSVSRAVFIGLFALGAFMVWRAQQARQLLTVAPRGDDDRSRSYIGHVGFNLVALLDGFVVVALFNGGLPGWGTALVGAGVALAGHSAVQELTRRFTTNSAVVTSTDAAI